MRDPIGQQLGSYRCRCCGLCRVGMRLTEDEIFDRILQSADYGTFSQQQAEELCGTMKSIVADFDGQLTLAGGPPEADEEVMLQQPVISQAGQLEVGKKRRTSVGAELKPKFLVVYTRLRRSAKLHKFGCEWTRVTLNDSLATSNINSQMYNTRCKLCFPQISKKLDGENDVCSESDQSDL